MSVQAANWVSLQQGLSKPARAGLFELARWVDSRGVALGVSKGYVAQSTGYSVSAISRAWAWLQSAGLLEISQNWVAGLSGSITVSRMGMHILPQVEPALVLPVEDYRFIGVTKRDPLQLALRIAHERCWDDAARATVVNELSRGLAERCKFVSANLLAQAWESVRVLRADIISSSDPWRIVLLDAFRKVQAEKDSQKRTPLLLGDVEISELAFARKVAVPVASGLDANDLVDFEVLLASRPLVSLVLVLIEGGTPAPLAWSGTLRVVQIAAANKPAHRYQKVKEDRLLAGMGVMPKQAEEWMRLVVGARGAGSKTLVPDGAEKATGLATWLGQVRAA